MVKLIKLNNRYNKLKIMLYAIVEMSGHQYWIEEQKYYDFNRIPTKIGKELTFNRILLLHNNDEVIVGTPYIENVIIKGKLINHIKDKKKINYKMRPKKKTRRKKGIRNKLSRVLIESMSINNK